MSIPLGINLVTSKGCHSLTVEEGSALLYNRLHTIGEQVALRIEQVHEQIRGLPTNTDVSIECLKLNLDEDMQLIEATLEHLRKPSLYTVNCIHTLAIQRFNTLSSTGCGYPQLNQLLIRLREESGRLMTKY